MTRPQTLQGLGQTTEFARAQDTVNLDHSVVANLVAAGIFTAVAYYAVKGFQRARSEVRGEGPDAIEELAAESRHIQQRNARRRSQRTH